MADRFTHQHFDDFRTVRWSFLSARRAFNARYGSSCGRFVAASSRLLGRRRQQRSSASRAIFRLWFPRTGVLGAVSPLLSVAHARCRRIIDVRRFPRLVLDGFSRPVADILFVLFVGRRLTALFAHPTSPFAPSSETPTTPRPAPASPPRCSARTTGYPPRP